MSGDANTELIRQFHKTVIVERKLDAISDYMDDALVDHISPDVEGSIDQYKQGWEGFFSAFPDLQATIEDLSSDGTFVVCRISLSGTHQGDFMGAPPTGRGFTTGSIQTYRIDDGKIAERWQYLDLMGLRTQLGM